MSETEIKVMNNDEIRDFCIKKDLKIFELKQENERLNNIIKEVREIFKDYGTKEDIVDYSNYTITGEMLYKLLEILDKGDNHD